MSCPRYDDYPRPVAKRFKEMSIALVLALIIMTLVCCGVSYPTVAPETEAEMLLIAETARFADLQRVKVRGEITERHYAVENGSYGCTAPAGCEALGWYNGGVAYYNRAMIVTFIEPNLAYATDTACHEVCHAKSPQHDLAHWDCMTKWANPTYPRPVGSD